MQQFSYWYIVTAETAVDLPLRCFSDSFHCVLIIASLHSLIILQAVLLWSYKMRSGISSSLLHNAPQRMANFNDSF